MVFSSVFKLPATTVYLTLVGGMEMLFSMVFTVSSIYQVTIVGLSPLQLVLVGTALEMTVFLLEIPTGAVADVYSRKRSIIIGLVLIGAGFVLEASFALFWTLLLAQLIWGTGYTFTSGATQAWISDEIGEANAGKVFLRGSQLGSVGALTGILAGVVLGSIRVTVPMFLGGGLFIALGLFLSLTMPEVGFTPARFEEGRAWRNLLITFEKGVQVVRRKPKLTSILVIGLFYGLYSEGFDRLWTKHILDSYTFPAIGNFQAVVWIGAIRAGGMLLSIGGLEFAKRHIGDSESLCLVRALLVLTIGLIVGIFVFAVAPGFLVVLLAYWMIYIVRTVIQPLYTSWVNLHLESQIRATVLSMSSQVDAIGQIAGGPIAGLIGNTLSVPAVFIACGIGLSPILGLYARFFQKNRVVRES